MTIGYIIRGTAAIVPRRQVTSAEFDQRVGRNIGWIEENFHISSRAVVGPDETSSGLGTEAAR